MNPEFHIHINGSYILPFLINRCILEVGVRNVPFNFSHGYSSRYAPHHHLSKKYSDIRKFKHDFDKLHYLLSNGDFEGYIEGEYVYLSENIGDIPLRSTDDFSFRLINSGCKAFRMSEVHLSLDFERSDKLLIDRLIGLGMFPCILPKVDYTAIMLSAQGNKKSIGLIVSELKRHIKQNGGVYKCKLKEERTIRNYVSSSNVVLPEQVSLIWYHTIGS